MTKGRKIYLKYTKHCEKFNKKIMGFGVWKKFKLLSIGQTIFFSSMVVNVWRVYVLPILLVCCCSKNNKDKNIT